jgi:hypothetical protein
MRLLLFMTGVLVAILCVERPAEAQNYPWCAQYGASPQCAHELRLCNLSAVSGHYQRNWRVLRPQ